MNLKLKPNLKVLVPLTKNEMVLHLKCDKGLKNNIGWLSSTYIVLFYLAIGLWTLILTPIPLFFFWQSRKIKRQIIELEQGDELNLQFTKTFPVTTY